MFDVVQGATRLRQLADLTCIHIKKAGCPGFAHCNVNRAQPGAVHAGKAYQVGTGIHHRRGIQQIIRAYCGERTGLREIRKSLECGMLKAATLRNRAYDALDVIAEAIAQLDSAATAR